MMTPPQSLTELAMPLAISTGALVVGSLLELPAYQIVGLLAVSGGIAAGTAIRAAVSRLRPPRSSGGT